MPTPGLSLVGFLEEPQALVHLKTACCPADSSDHAILQQWNAARAALGEPFQNAGRPDIQPLPPEQMPHITALLQAPWTIPAFAAGGPLHGVSFQLVEVDPLLAYQFTTDSDRSEHLCKTLSQPPSLAELMQVCLPVTPPEPMELQATPAAQSILIRSRSLNVRMNAGGIFNSNFGGIQFGGTLPFLHVVRLNGRCYLHNGYHRAVGARRAGATHVPCVFREAQDYASAGIAVDGTTFAPAVLESPNPPTLGHFTQGRALEVQLRVVNRFLHVSWAEYAVPVE